MKYSKIPIGNIQITTVPWIITMKNQRNEWLFNSKHNLLNQSDKYNAHAKEELPYPTGI